MSRSATPHVKERWAFWQETAAIKAVERRRRRGRVTEVLLYRYLNEVFLRSGTGALSVHWLEITSVHAKTGEHLYHNSFITHIPKMSHDNEASPGGKRPVR